MGTITLERLTNLFWLGRYIERVYQSSRHFSEIYDHLIDDDEYYYEEFCRNFGLVGRYASSEEYVADFFNPENPHSIVANLDRAFDNGLVMRDEISSEALSYIHLAMAVTRRLSGSEAPVRDLQRVGDCILAFWGCLDDQCDSEETRSAVKAGKRIERLDLFVRFRRPKEELQSEVRRLMSRIQTSGMPYNRRAMMYTAAMVEEDEIDYEALIAMVMKIFE